MTAAEVMARGAIARSRKAGLRWRYMQAEDRFWARVVIDGECWLWIGEPGSRYGLMRLNGRVVQAHRYAYELLRGPIPVGLTIDHLCRRTKCVNPAHMEPVTHRENVARGISPHGLNAAKTHCKYGHPFDAANTRLSRQGRACRLCHRRTSQITERRRQDRSSVVEVKACIRCGVRIELLASKRPCQRRARRFCTSTCGRAYGLALRWERHRLRVIAKARDYLIGRNP